MAWYGTHSDATKKLDQLIDQNPSLEQLLNYPDFLPQLKAYNPKLLDFLTNSQTIVADCISLLAVPPKDNDSDDRKYRYPALAIEMIQSEAMSIINSFFKEDQRRKGKFLNSLFEQMFADVNKVEGQVLPMLSGYFLRVNICLLNNKYKQTIDCMYQNTKNFDLLLQNSHVLSITNTLQVYLNLDLTKNPITIPERLTTKLNVINKMLMIIDESVQAEKKNQNEGELYVATLKVENLSTVLIQLLEKYYLIADGKAMVDQILCNQFNCKILFKGLTLKNSDICLSLLNIIISVVKFYSISSLNAEEWNNADERKKKEQKIQQQTAVVNLLEALPQLLTQLGKCKNFTIYEAKVIELINASLGLNSHRIFNCVRNFKYFQILFDILFRFEYCNVFGQMLQKLFIFVFRTERLLNEEIKHHIFCQAKIIDLTAARYLSQFQTDEQIANSMANAYRRKPYFGHLMKIMKIYSGIQTTDEDIINSIKSKSQIWNKISRLVLKPYEFIAFKELGTYENIPQTQTNEFSVKTTVMSNASLSMIKQAENTKVIDQINREEAIQNLKTLESPIVDNKLQAENIYAAHKQGSQNQHTRLSEDGFFETPAQNLKDKGYPALEGKSSDSSKAESQGDNGPGMGGLLSPILEKKANSYNDFIEKQKMKAETEIRKERSRSKQRALSKGKTRITSPSPSKRVNKWAQNPDEKPVETKQTKQKISLTGATKTQPKNLPKIPMHKKGINISSNDKDKQDAHNKSVEIEKKQLIENDIVQNKSMPNLEVLKKVKIVYKFDVPAKKQYRKINDEDKTIFECLGISYS